MKRNTRLTLVPLLISVAPAVFPQTSRSSEVKKIYFLRDDTDMRWCGYAGQLRYKAQATLLNPMVVGAADYDSGRIAKVRVTEEDESGDWVVYDEYTVSEGSKIRTLKRVINIIPEDNSEEQVFSMVDGKAVKQRSAHHELRSGKPTGHTVEWFESPSIITRPQMFPFWTLLNQSKAVWANGEACVRDVTH